MVKIEIAFIFNAIILSLLKNPVNSTINSSLLPNITPSVYSYNGEHADCTIRIQLEDCPNERFQIIDKGMIESLYGKVFGIGKISGKRFENLFFFDDDNNYNFRKNCPYWRRYKPDLGNEYFLGIDSTSTGLVDDFMESYFNSYLCSVCKWKTITFTLMRENGIGTRQFVKRRFPKLILQEILRIKPIFLVDRENCYESPRFHYDGGTYTIMSH
ncbi:hypothetical protein SNEBB_009042 [Seison nebaliae]|nr:hypothetical protein SNEBB_009042 [Seison nebaliae]